MNASTLTQPSRPQAGVSTRPVLHSHHYHAALLRALYEAPEIDAAGLLRRAVAAAGPALALADSAEKTADELLVTRFRTCGLGGLELEGLREDGTGKVALQDSHSALAWATRYAGARRPVCGIASGVLTRLLGDQYDRPLEVREIECAVMGAERCRFEVTAGEMGKGGRDRKREGKGPGYTVNHAEGRYAPLESVPLGAGPGAPFLALPAEFYASISHFFEVEVPRVRGTKFASLPAILLMEAGHRNGFHVFGEALGQTRFVDCASRDATDYERLEELLRLVERLGWGEWRIQSFLPGERLLVRIPDSYEGLSHLRLFGRSSVPRCTVAVGAAAAMMNLLYRAPEGRLPALSPSFYNSLFRNPHSFRGSETRCIAHGDDFCELVVNPLTA